jgi:hypothetical protein
VRCLSDAAGIGRAFGQARASVFFVFTTVRGKTMNASQIRSTLSSAVGTLELVVAQLSRAEHGESRDVVARARVDLKTASSELLVLRAKLCGDRPATTDPHELFRTPFRVE